MSTHVEEIQSHGPGIPTFAKVWVALLAMTAIEVFLAYMQTPMMIMLTVLLGLSVIKAALIIAYFMHLKFERRLLGILFASTLILGLILVSVGMAEHFLPRP